MDRDRLTGIAWFLFIPLVLVLFTQPPGFLGPGWALLLGAAIMVAHRFVAEPWVLARAGHRCLWSGRTLPAHAPVHAIDVRRGDRHYPFLAATERERRHLASFMRFAQRYAPLLRIGILLPLLFFLVSTFVTEVAGTPWFGDQRAWSLAIFQGTIAVTVITTAIAYRFVPPGDPGEPLAFPLPVHNLALLGVRNTMVVFALVGSWWIWVTFRRLIDLLA
ncbi:MAG: hypothetical protein H6834_11885 [Planctomycetes bacterium]|nr:hypothetical protein [Planctomycetota bacterium]